MWLPNPDDERFRELERRAATGDPTALAAIGADLNRRGLCARCRQHRESMPARTSSGVNICEPCSATVELEAFGREPSYTGYLSSQRDIATPHAPEYSITTFLGFPLALVFDTHRMSERGISWRAIDRHGNTWYGRAIDHGFVTGMRRAVERRDVHRLGREPYARARFLEPLRLTQGEWIRTRGGAVPT